MSPADFAGCSCRIAKSTFFDRLVALGIVLTLALSGAAWAQPGGGGGGSATCTITTVPTPPVITAGQSVQFTGDVSGKTPKTYAWTFQGGSPSSSNQQTVTVSYANSGSFAATLNGTNGKGQTCTASVTVTVNPVNNCVRNAPTFSMGADQTIAPDGSAVYTLSVTNNDTAACPASTFGLAINSETGATGSFNLPSTLSTNSVTVAPGATNTTARLTVTGSGTGANNDALTSTVTASDPTTHRARIRPTPSPPPSSSAQQDPPRAVTPMPHHR